jgi:hypothetical protein
MQQNEGHRDEWLGPAGRPWPVPLASELSCRFRFRLGTLLQIRKTPRMRKEDLQRSEPYLDGVKREGYDLGKIPLRQRVNSHHHAMPDPLADTSYTKKGAPFATCNYNHGGKTDCAGFERRRCMLSVNQHGRGGYQMKVNTRRILCGNRVQRRRLRMPESIPGLYLKILVCKQDICSVAYSI